MAQAEGKGVLEGCVVNILEDAAQQIIEYL